MGKRGINPARNLGVLLTGISIKYLDGETATENFAVRATATLVGMVVSRSFVQSGPNIPFLNAAFGASSKYLIDHAEDALITEREIVEYD
jgi:hypothetical protein